MAIFSGDIFAENYTVSSSVTNVQISSVSGSTKSGDSADDTHQFTGSLSVSGSQIHLRRSALSGFDEYDDDLLVIERSGDYSNLNLVSDVGSYLLFSDADRAVGTIGYIHSSNKLTFGNNAVADRLVINANGQVGINDNNPQDTLHIDHASGTGGSTLGVRANGVSGKGNILAEGDI